MNISISIHTSTVKVLSIVCISKFCHLYVYICLGLSRVYVLLKDYWMYINIMRDIQLYIHISVWDYRKYIYFCRVYTPLSLRDLSFVYIFLFGIIESMYFLEYIFLWRIVGSILIFLEIYTPQLLWGFVSCIYLSVRDFRKYIYLCRIIRSIWISQLYISICSGLSRVYISV